MENYTSHDGTFLDVVSEIRNFGDNSIPTKIWLIRWDYNDGFPGVVVGMRQQLYSDSKSDWEVQVANATMSLSPTVNRTIIGEYYFLCEADCQEAKVAIVKVLQTKEWLPRWALAAKSEGWISPEGWKPQSNEY